METPKLTPQNAAALLEFNQQAQDYLTYLRKEDSTCQYKLDLPEQAARPTTLDVQHIVYCGGKPAPPMKSATVTFVYDKNAKRWRILRFSS